MYLSRFVLRFVPLESIVLPKFTGHIVLSLFLRMLGSVDAKYASYLHDYKGVKPYAVKPFMGDRGVLYSPEFKGVILKSGNEYFFQVSLVQEEPAKKFLEALTTSVVDSTFRLLGRSPITITDVSIEVHDLEDLEPEFTDDRFKVRFITPTRFSVRRRTLRRKPLFSLVPTPLSLFHSLVHHWNTFAPPSKKIKEERFLDWILDNVYESDLRLRADVAPIGDGKKVIGVVGYVIYRVEEPESSYLRDMFLLLRYGEYFNVGNSRSMGLGVMDVTKVSDK
ncbi:CRISPR-associated endoribonuclease Cas6 [Candidatus Woesearchaeota archaeon]|nr:MAG: CRISPR-associated endoribonuclease Cas6 [Candidatus Woesearchaeota archaeon]